ncbi:MAG TPA: CDP-archaeol synthase [Rhizomicrobium sp.]|nr:CDP-archaeol synthase [Rhizomicrobium sp.]
MSADHAPGYRAIRFNMDWITRPLFGILLAAGALFAVGNGPIYVAILAGIGLTLASFEWHRCVGQGRFHAADVAITAGTVLLTEAVYLLTGHLWAGFLVVAAGTGAGFGWARNQDDSHPYWRGLGALYLAIPALSLVALCDTQRGPLTVACMLVIVWFTDIGALVFGNLIGGPRLAPKISPGKTWAGTIGGSVSAALAFLVICLLFIPSNRPLTALGFGFLFSFVAHAGDLFESLVKRRFGIKDSGSIIPGHGGVLDRIDSLLAAATVMALFVFGMHFNPVLWGAV